MAQSNTPEDDGNTLPTAAIAALNKGNRIEAIKIVRIERRIGLKQAKERVEAYLASQPELQRKIAAKQAEVRRRMLIWLVSLLLLGAAALYYLLFKPG